MRYAERSIARGSGAASPSTWSVTGRPARPTSAEQGADAVEAGLGRELEVVAVAAHRDSSRRISASAVRPACSTPAERPGLVLELVGKLVAHGADLEHHDAHGVGDDVVELPRDPRPLLGDGDPRRGLALPLGLRRARLGGVGLLGPRVEREAREPGDPEEERDEDELAGRCRAG